MSKFQFSALLVFCQVLVMVNAQNAIIPLYLGIYGEGQPEMFGSVVAVVSGITSYEVECVATTVACFFPTSSKFPAIQGPGTAAYTIPTLDSQSGFTEHCNLEGTTVATCTTEGNALDGTNTYDLQTTNTGLENRETVLLADVTITGGLSLLSGLSTLTIPSTTASGALPTGAGAAASSTTDSSESAPSTASSSTINTATITSMTTTTASTTSASSSSSKGSAQTIAAQAGSGILAIAALGLYYAL